MGKLLGNSQAKHAPLRETGNFLKSVKFPLKGVPFNFVIVLIVVPLIGKSPRLNLTSII